MGTKVIIIVIVCFFLFSILVSREVRRYEEEKLKKCMYYCMDFTGDSRSFMTTNYCCCDNDSPFINGSFKPEYCVPIEILMRIEE